MDKDPFKYQHKDQADLDAGRPLSYHTPAIKKEKARKAKSEALKKKKVYISPTGSKHHVGSAKHKYWEDIERRGKEDKKYGVGD